MSQKLSMFLFLVFVAGSVTAISLVRTKVDAAEDEVRALIEAAYLNGAFNDLDTASMKAGFHPVFKIHGVRDGKLSQYPIDAWISSIEKRKASADFKPEKWDYKFALLDVTGNAGIAKIELFKDGTHVYTDYLSVLKLGDGWKITDKVYYRHTQ